MRSRPPGFVPPPPRMIVFKRGWPTAFFLRFWQAGLAAYDAFNGIDWSWLSMDGAMTKAPLAGEKNRPQPDGPRQERHQTLVARGVRRRAGGFIRRRREQKRLQAVG